MRSSVKIILVLLVIGAIAISSAVPVSADVPFLGEIRLFPYSFAPVGWLECDGRTLSVSDYSALYATFGNTYGGNGSTTFALPDLRGLEPYPGIKYCICTTNGIFPTRE